ncbi:MAG TPA: nicotinate-nucleotide adenylyltransferase [Gaiellaceae bacterium]|nr:nicotinate-nucleotide adenylyltransferase [Gaiellaceae bacterium]
MAVARVGVLGGAFDPPHAGHVALARAAVEQLGLEELRVLVVAEPGHRQVRAPAAARLELARLAFADVPGARVELDPHARTVDSLEALGLDDPVFVVGADELVGFSRWKEPERVLALARLAVAMRPGVPAERAREARARVPAPDRILFFELEPVPVSSTEVRARLARGEPIDGLVPPAVAEAIARLGLYRDGE